MTIVEAQEVRGATALITGADGGIGSHLPDVCLEEGAYFHAFVRATSSGALNNIEHLRDRITVHRFDETDINSVHQSLAALRGNASKHDGQPRHRLDASRAEREFGFRAGIRLDEGLRRPVNWNVGQRADADPRHQPVLPS